MDGEETKLSVVATSRVNKGDYTRDYMGVSEQRVGEAS